MSKRQEDEERTRKHIENVINMIMDGNKDDEDDNEEWTLQDRWH